VGLAQGTVCYAGVTISEGEWAILRKHLPDKPNTPNNYSDSARSKVCFGRILDLVYRPFGGVHAFGYESAESEPIWMKSGALLGTYVGGWPWQILSAIGAVARVTLAFDLLTPE